jgi:hypothetical protein
MMAMWQDPIVEEVRRVRREILAEFDNDFAAYVKHLMKEQKKLGDRLVCLGPKPPASQPVGIHAAPKGRRRTTMPKARGPGRPRRVKSSSLH